MSKYLLKLSYLLLLYPLYVLEYVAEKHVTESEIETDGRFTTYIFIYLLTYFIPRKFFKTLFVWLTYIVCVCAVFLEASYYILYKSYINSSAVFIIIETNRREMYEYLSTYFNGDILKLFFTLLIPSVFILWGVKKAIYQYDINLTFKTRIPILKTISGFIGNIWIKTQESLWLKYILGIVVFGIAFYGLREDTLYKNSLWVNFSEGYREYVEEMEKNKDYFLTDENSPILKTVVPKTDDGKETLIITIGESTTKYNLGIYGYYRNTTPKLQQIEDELVVFKDVISPHSHTLESLEKVMTFGNYEDKDAKRFGSLIQLLKAAGYKTYWISNQAPVGLWETQLTMMAKVSDFVYYTNVMGGKNLTYIYDEELLPVVKSVLKRDVPKKVIFVHLMGTHANFYQRYPEQFNVFKDSAKTPFPSERSLTLINEYDNAVLYNDSILSAIINYLKQSERKEEALRFIYFSDHGEEVYRTIDFVGHTESIGTYPMFEIPFIYWSNSVNEINKYRGYRERKYMIDDFIYSVADLLDITFDGMLHSRSIFSDSFAERTRIVKGGVDYDIEISPNNKYGEKALVSDSVLKQKYYDKIWVHRVNSIEKLKEVAPYYAGVEVDIEFDPIKPNFDVNHSPAVSIGLSLKEYLKANPNKDLKFWLDLKNLSINNVESIVNRLNHIVSSLKLDKSNFIVESENAPLLKHIHDIGFQTSYYLHYPGINTLSKKEQEAKLEEIEHNLIPEITYLSSPYDDFDILKKRFPDKQLNLWVGKSDRPPKEEHLYRLRVARDPMVNVLLIQVATKAPFR